MRHPADRPVVPRCLRIEIGDSPAPQTKDQIPVPRPIEALIHPDALAHNLARARLGTGGARVWAVA